MQLVIEIYRGAEAVYRYGIGVMSLPQPKVGTQGHDEHEAGVQSVPSNDENISNNESDLNDH